MHSGSLWHNSRHYIEAVPNPNPARDPVRQAYRETARSRRGPGESDRSAEAVYRRLLGPAEGRKVVAAEREAVSILRCSRMGTSWRRWEHCGRSAGPRPRPPASPPRPGHCHCRERADRAGLEAGDGARARSGDRHLQPRRGCWACGLSTKTSSTAPWMAAATAAGDREVPGQEAPCRRRAGSLRRHLELPRGRCCPLAKLGYHRDGKKGKLQIVYGLLCAAMAARWWSKCSMARPPIERPWPPRSLSSRTASAGRAWRCRRPRHDHPSPPRRRDQAGRARLDTALRGRAIRRFSTPAPSSSTCSTSGTWPHHLAGLSRRTAWSAAIRNWRACGRGSRGLAERHRTHLALIREAVRRARNRCAARRNRVKVAAVLNKHKMAKHFETTIEDESFTSAAKPKPSPREPLSMAFMSCARICRWPCSTTPVRRRLQAPQRGRAGLPLPQDRGPGGPPDLPLGLRE